MISVLALRNVLRGTVASRVVGGLQFRYFADASKAGGQRPIVPPSPPRPPASNPTPQPSATPTIQPGAGASSKGPPTPPAKPIPATNSSPPQAPVAPPPPAKPASATNPPRSQAPVATAAVSAKSKAKASSSRDPERPKRPASAWLRYLADFRKQNTSLKGAEVMRTAATKWKATTTEQRKPYEAAYEAEKKIYDKAFAEYVDSGKRDAWKRDPEKPKRPQTGFIRFVGEYRSKHPALKVTEVTKKAGTLWKSMTSGAKEPYEQKYVAEKAEYDKLLKAYKDSGKEAAYKEKKGLTAAEKRAAKAKEKEVARKEKEAAGKLKKKEAEAKRKEKEAAKKLKAKEAVAKQKEKEAATKTKVKEAAATAKPAKAMQATTKG